MNQNCCPFTPVRHSSAQLAPVLVLLRARHLVAALACAGALGGASAAESATTVWRIDRTDVIAGRPVQMLGAPRVVESPHGQAVEFAGKSEGLLLTGRSPLSGARQYTIEVLACPDISEAEKQKFLHIPEQLQQAP